MHQLDTPSLVTSVTHFSLGKNKFPDGRPGTSIFEKAAVWPLEGASYAGSTSYWDMHRALGTCSDKNFFQKFPELNQMTSFSLLHLSFRCTSWQVFLKRIQQHNFFLAPLRDNRAAVKVSSPKLLDLAFQIVFYSPGKMGSAPALAQTPSSNICTNLRCCVANWNRSALAIGYAQLR